MAPVGATVGGMPADAAAAACCAAAMRFCASVAMSFNEGGADEKPPAPVGAE